MTRAAILACWPWLATLVVLVVCLRLTVRLNQARLEWRRLIRLHADEGGGAQTLSFVLTLPIFIMVMLLIVQVSQLMIGTIIVHYAAFAAARAAIVWIPANLGYKPIDPQTVYFDKIAKEWKTTDSEVGAPDNAENYVGTITPTPEDYDYPNDGGYLTYKITVSSTTKWNKVRLAAAMACMPISPSRDGAATEASDTPQIGSNLQAVYAAMAPDSTSDSRVSQRLLNKLWYSWQHTYIGDKESDGQTYTVTFYHKKSEPPLVQHNPGDSIKGERDPKFNDFHPPYEIGWQDPMVITVTHDLALLPGPGRLLAKFVKSPTGNEDTVAKTIAAQNTSIYTYPLKAQAMLSNLGEKSVARYEITTN